MNSKSDREFHHEEGPKRLEDLPQQILERIFSQLNFRDRVRLERVCRSWWALGHTYGWTGQRHLRFTREMLRIPEPWRQKDQIDRMAERWAQRQAEVTAQLVRLHEEAQKEQLGHGAGEEKEHACAFANLCNFCSAKLSVVNGNVLVRLKESEKAALQHYKRVLADPDLYKHRRPSRTLAVLRALLERTGPHLLELHLCPGIGIATRFGRHLHLLSRLAHLRIDEPLDEWHIQLIQKHFARQLNSLSIHANKRKRSRAAFAKLLADCPHLEVLRVGYFQDLFTNEPESGKLALIMPPTLKYLHNWLSENWDVSETEAKGWALLASKCPELRYFLPFLSEQFNPKGHSDDPEMIAKFFDSQWPFFYTKQLDLLLDGLHPRLHSLRALKLHPYCIRVDSNILRQIAAVCPQLEHFSFTWRNYVRDFRGEVDISQLEALYEFKCLSSLGVCIEVVLSGCVNESMPFHELYCVGGDDLDEALLEILKRLNDINRLRSLEFQPYLSFDFNRGYVCQMVQHLAHLETFSCTLTRRYNFDDSEMSDAQFERTLCAVLGELALTELQLPAKRSFRFMPAEYNDQKTDSVLETQLAQGKRQFEWHSIPSRRTHGEFYEFKSDRSIVLQEILERHIGHTAMRTLFGTSMVE